MAYKREFIVDKVYKVAERNEFHNVIVRIEAYWKITNDEYPKGFRNYDLSKDINNNCHGDTFIEIDKVTDADLERWLTKDMTTQDKIDVELESQPELIRTNMMDTWIVHYDRNA